MTLNTGIFDVSDPQNPDRVYSAALLSRILSKHIRDGIVHGDGDGMAVTVTDPPAMTVRVGTGTAMVQGRFCENDAALTLAVPAAHATYPRIDRVVVRLNASPGRTIDIVVKPGTAAPEPAAPALTRTAEIWELSLAQVRVEAGATSIGSSKITDERGDADLCGDAAPAWVPSSQIGVVGDVDAAGHRVVGLGAPTGAADAATKGYTDGEIAAKIGGFGISDIAIDEDKDWNGKKITNLGALHTQSLDVAACRTYPSASDHLRATGAPSLVLNKNAVRPFCTIPSIYGPGTVRVSVSIEIAEHTSAGSYWICVGGVKKSEKTYSGGEGVLSWTADVECEGGQEIGILTDAYNQYTWEGKITSWSVGADDPFSPAW